MWNFKSKNRKILAFTACLLIAALILISVGQQSAKADSDIFVAGNSGTYTGDFSMSDIYPASGGAISQSFIVAGSSLQITTASCALDYAGSPVCNISAALYDCSGATGSEIPSSAPLCVSVPIAFSTSNLAPTFNFINGAVMAHGNDFCLVIFCSSGTLVDGSNYVAVETTPQNLEGNCGWWIGSWITYDDKNMIFSVYGATPSPTPTPTPSPQPTGSPTPDSTATPAPTDTWHPIGGTNPTETTLNINVPELLLIVGVSVGVFVVLRGGKKGGKK